jgi:pimeloyl-ACP methyl ester carboxylesterase
VHPFGRHCIGYKHAGEEDLESVLRDVMLRYGMYNPTIVLVGFSMGGAGAWHLGAHFTDHFVAISPGAGFAETARYQKLVPEQYPPWYEQKLWGQYDVPNYVRNLFNTEVIAYSGEYDKQIQAARVMEEAYRLEGHELTHLIGPGVEHRYEPTTLADLLQRLDAIAAKGMDRKPKRVFLQTQTLDYHRQHWVQLDGLEEHWKDARVDAEMVGANRLKVTTKNVSALWLHPYPNMAGTMVEIDGQEVEMRDPQNRGPNEKALFKEEGTWKSGLLSRVELRKNMDLHGPIDDAFKQGFVVVTPSGVSKNKRFQQWMEFELRHLRDRWRALMRAELPEASDEEVLAQLSPQRPHSGTHLILWGDADSNAVVRRLGDRLPAKFAGGKWKLGDVEYDGDHFVPAAIYPFPGSADSYVVLNSGLTFREGHDRTNSLQNPKLPDWAVIDITQPPDALAPGRIHDAGFFDERWQLKNQPRAP